jgi:flagellar FliL protein
MRSSRVIVVLLVLNLLVMGAVAAYFMTQRPFTGDAQAAGGDSAEQRELSELSAYQFLPIEKIIVGVRGAKREHYVVIDLALQISAKVDSKLLPPIVPVVRNSVVAQLSGMRYETLRRMTIVEVQELIEQTLFDDFAARRLKAPFEHVLVSKMLAQ